MKLSKIITIVLMLLCVAAVVLSALSLVDIRNELSDDGKTDGTSAAVPSDPDDDVDSDGSEGNTDSENYLEGNVVKTATAREYDTPGLYKVNSGVACVKRIDNVTYCYVRYDVSDLNCTLVTYHNLVLDPYTCVFRYSTDGEHWSLLDNYRTDYSGNWNQASVSKNGSDYIYICFYTITDSTSSLENILNHFENSMFESHGVCVTNVAG